MRCRTASRAALGTVYLAIGQPERWVEWCRAQLARAPRHPRPSSGHGWLSHLRWPVPVRRRWIARMA